MNRRIAEKAREKAKAPAIEVGLNAAIVAVEKLAPLILVVEGEGEPRDSLPFGPFDPLRHRTLEIGLRAWVEAQTHLKLGYVEQLYTFGDRGRHAQPADTDPRVMSVGYLALTRRSPESDEVLERSAAGWRPWYEFFPWEDWRQGRPELLDRSILPLLEEWCDRPADADGPARPIPRRDRVKLSFGEGGLPWDEERVLDRFELLYAAGLAEEALRDGRPAALERGKLPPLGVPMRHDHRRILATAISRLRGKLKYRPVVFELMPESFTLTELQRTVEAISGRHLHKQNFRRLVEQGQLVEPTGGTSTATGGRPAALFRFRREVLQERPAPGFRLGGRA
ncbi:MAG: NUDIX hydrolase [Propylenella sp.]